VCYGSTAIVTVWKALGEELREVWCSCQVFAPRQGIFTGTERPLKRTSTRGIFPIKGSTIGICPFLKGVRHAKVYHPPHGAGQPLRPG